MPTPFGQQLNDVLFVLPQGSVITASGNQTFSTNQVTNIAFDATVSAITGGSGSPGIALTIARLAADGVSWFTIMTTTISSATAPSNFITLDLGPGMGTYSGGANGSQHAVFGTTGRISWALSGTVPPTSVTLSASLIGR